MRFIPLFSGSSGNCSVIQTEKATLLVDAGLTGKAVCGADFRRKGGIGGKTQSKVLPQRLRLSFESVVDFIDTLNCRLMTENFAWQNGLSRAGLHRQKCQTKE